MGGVFLKKTIKNMSINLINEDIYLTMNLINELKNHGKKNRYLEKYLKNLIKEKNERIKFNK